MVLFLSTLAMLLKEDLAGCTICQDLGALCRLSLLGLGDVGFKDYQYGGQLEVRQLEILKHWEYDVMVHFSFAQ
jgi:hypothetical protein